MTSHVNKSHMTAIKRTALSAPARLLLERGLLKGRVLDFGCGHGDLCRFGNFPSGTTVAQYDPYWYPERPKGKFDTVYAGFVLNVLPKKEWIGVLVDILGFLVPGGTAYLAVRRDVKKEGLTSRGTEQYNVILPAYGFKSVQDCPNHFAIYILEKRQEENEENEDYASN